MIQNLISFPWDTLKNGVPTMPSYKLSSGDTLKETSFRTAQYQGYFFPKSKVGSTSTYEITPYYKKNLKLIFSKKQLTPYEKLPSTSKVHMRIFPYPNLVARGRDSQTGLPHWIFSRKAYADRKVSMRGTSTFYMTDSNMCYIFRGNDSNNSVALGARIGDTYYPNLGHIYIKWDKFKSKHMTRHFPVPCYSMCKGSLDFLVKNDSYVDNFNKNTSWGWNTDLTCILNITSLKSVDGKNPLASLCLPGPGTFDITKSNQYLYRPSPDNSSFINMDYNYVPIFGLVDMIDGKDLNTPVKNPNTKNPLYSKDLFLIQANNDLLVQTANSNAIHRSSKTIPINTLNGLPELFVESSLEDKYVSSLIAEMSNEEGVLWSDHPISIYHILFDKILDDVYPLLPNNFRESIDNLPTFERRAKAIVFCQMLFLGAVEYAKNNAEDSNKLSNRKEALLDFAEKNKTAVDIMRTIAQGLTENIIMESLKEFHEIVLSLA